MARRKDHTPEELKALKEAGYTDEQIGKRSDLEYSKLDTLAGEVLKASSLEDLAVIAQKYIPKGKSVKQTRNWSDALNEIVEAQSRIMEQKAKNKDKILT